MRKVSKKKLFKENKQKLPLTTDIWVAQVMHKDFSLNKIIPFLCVWFDSYEIVHFLCVCLLSGASYICYDCPLH